MYGTLFKALKWKRNEMVDFILYCVCFVFAVSVFTVVWFCCLHRFFFHSPFRCACWQYHRMEILFYCINLWEGRERVRGRESWQAARECERCKYCVYIAFCRFWYSKYGTMALIKPITKLHGFVLIGFAKHSIEHVPYIVYECVSVCVCVYIVMYEP